MKNGFVLALSGSSLLVLVLMAMFIPPLYNLWRVDMDGQAQLKAARYANDIESLQAKTGLSTAKYLPLKNYLDDKKLYNLGDVDSEYRRILIDTLNKD